MTHQVSQEIHHAQQTIEPTLRTFAAAAAAFAALTPAETKRVSGGGSNVQHGNPGGDTPIGSPGYGPPGGNGGASNSGGFDVHDHE
jgi:hypothetical protein